MYILDKHNIPWELKTLSNKMKDGIAVVDSTSQRGLVWKKATKNDFIESVICNVHMGAIICNKKGEKYSIIDGQQKADTLTKFINGEFTLEGLEPVTLKNGTVVNLDGKIFSDLPLELQNIIKKRQITVYYYDNLTPEEEAFVIRKVNNGKPMTSVERALVGAKSYPIYKELRSHQLFKVALSEIEMNKSTYAEIIVKAWILLYGENVCFDQKVFEPAMQKTIMQSDEKETLINVFNRIEEVYQLLINRKEDKRKSKKAAKLMLKKIHMLSLVPLVKQTIDENIEADKLADWIVFFFSGEDKTTISDVYNENIKKGTGHASAIKARDDAIKKSWDAYLKN